MYALAQPSIAASCKFMQSPFGSLCNATTRKNIRSRRRLSVKEWQSEATRGDGSERASERASALLVPPPGDVVHALVVVEAVELAEGLRREVEGSLGTGRALVSRVSSDGLAVVVVLNGEPFALGSARRIAGG